MRTLSFLSLVVAAISQTNYKCNFMPGIFPTGVCYSAKIGLFTGSAKFTCDPANLKQVSYESSTKPDCPSDSTKQKLPIVSNLGYCGGTDCYTSLAAYTSADCTGTAFSAGLYAGGEHCQSGRRYYCDSRGFYIYLYLIGPVCLGNWGRVVIHTTGCEKTDLSSYGIPSYIKSFHFGRCQTANPPPGNFPLRISYHTKANCAGNTEAVSFEAPLLDLGCLFNKYEYFCATDGFYKYEYADNTNCTGNVQEVSHVPNKCLVDFTENLITSANFGSVSFQCVSGGPAPRPIAFGAAVEASNIKVYADSVCSIAEEIRQVYAKAAQCRPMSELRTSNIFPTSSNSIPSGEYYKLTCTSTGYQIQRFSSSTCTGVLETKSGKLGECVSLATTPPIYVSVKQCQTNLNVATPKAVAATNGASVVRGVLVWGVVLVAGLVWS